MDIREVMAFGYKEYVVDEMHIQRHYRRFSYKFPNGEEVSVLYMPGYVDQWEVLQDDKDVIFNLSPKGVYDELTRIFNRQPKEDI
jgi:hypothetical protein